MEKIGKLVSGRGFCSRRTAEKLVKEGRVEVNGHIVNDVALRFPTNSEIKINDKILGEEEEMKIWIHHKIRGTIVSTKDLKRRKTLLGYLANKLGRKHVLAVGRLDMNSEGLLILTNRGSFKRYLELPSTELTRTYDVQIGTCQFPDTFFSSLSRGISIDGVDYKPIYCKLLKTQSEGNIHWIRMELQEGKNREIRKIMAHFGISIIRLKRIKYGPFSLSQVKLGQTKEVLEYDFSARKLISQFKSQFEKAKF